MSSGVGRRHRSDPMLLWLWCRPAATAPLQPLAWKPPYATSVALKVFFFFKKRERQECQVSGITLGTSIHLRTIPPKPLIVSPLRNTSIYYLSSKILF